MNKVLRINNSYVNDIISSQISYKSLLDEDLVIAGGFPLSVYMYYKLCKEEHLPIMTKYILNRDMDYLKYTDIDIWPLESLDNSFLKEVFSNNAENTLPLNEKINFRFTKKSKWANTISNTTLDKRMADIQFVKNYHKNPDELISTFDLDICKVAWSKGVLYVDEGADKDIENGTLSFGSNHKYGEETFLSRLYMSLRYMKYSKRYSLDPSPDICEYIFKTYLESSYKENIDSLSSKPNTNDVSTVNLSTIKGYNLELNVVNRINLYNSFINDVNYTWFSKQKNYNVAWALFLINHPFISCIKNLIDGSKDINDNEFIF